MWYPEKYYNLSLLKKSGFCEYPDEIITYWEVIIYVQAGTCTECSRIHLLTVIPSTKFQWILDYFKRSPDYSVMNNWAGSICRFDSLRIQFFTSRSRGEHIYVNLWDYIPSISGSNYLSDKKINLFHLETEILSSNRIISLLTSHITR